MAMRAIPMAECRFHPAGYCCNDTPIPCIDTNRLALPYLARCPAVPRLQPLDSQIVSGGSPICAASVRTEYRKWTALEFPGGFVAWGASPGASVMEEASDQAISGRSRTLLWGYCR